MQPSFFFLRKTGPQRYIETFGVDFEDFEIGQVYEHRPGKTVLEGEANQHDIRSLDHRPFVTDHHFANQVSPDGRPVSESYVLGLMALSTKTFGKVVANLSMTDVVVGPVYVGDTLYFESEILDKRKSQSRPSQGVMRVETRAVNQDGRSVLSYQRQFLIYRRGEGPYEKAGY